MYKHESKKIIKKNRQRQVKIAQYCNNLNTNLIIPH